MSKMKSKNKLTKEQKQAQLQAELAQKKALEERAEKVKLLRAKARQIHDIIAKSGKSIEETKQFIQSIAREIDNIFNNRRLKTSVKELDIKVDTGTEDNDKFVKDILAIVIDSNVTDSVELLNGMSNVIDAVVRVRNTKTKFSEIAEEMGNALASNGDKENK